MQNKEALIKREGVAGLDNSPLFLDEADGNIYVQTQKGEVKLGVLPQTILEKAESSEDIDSIEEIEIESDDSSNNGEESKLEIPSTVYYDTQTGEHLRSEKSFINNILDLLSR